ncbi:MAG: hypothetical protein ICV73_11570 [Acetobacteraceae bacterium]|nr:hypothetical protein [Acetobacteraceae bacterium]
MAAMPGEADAIQAETALRENGNTRGDVRTPTDMVLALTRQARRMGDGGA